jgi:hypothetical protein
VITRRQLVISLIFFVVIGLAAIGGGVYQLWQQRAGTPAKATVRSCEQSRRSLVCRGSWTTGSLLEGGRVVLGIVENATKDDIGKTLDVRLHGDRAYLPSLRLPIIFFVVGAAFLILGPFSQLRRRRRPRIAEHGSLDAPRPTPSAGS